MYRFNVTFPGDFVPGSALKKRSNENSPLSFVTTLLIGTSFGSCSTRISAPGTGSPFIGIGVGVRALGGGIVIDLFDWSSGIVGVGVGAGTWRHRRSGTG